MTCGPRRISRCVLALVMAAVVGCADDGAGDAAPTTAAPRSTSSSTTLAEREPNVEPAALEGPIAVGRLSPPADPRPIDLAAVGYVESEWFAAGTATAYTGVGELGTDGRWAVEPVSTAPYRTRMVVRFPSDPDRFSGAVVLEWLNVTAVEAAPDWSYLSQAIVDDGAAWIGVSAQAFGVVGGRSLLDTGLDEQDAASGGVRAVNPERYGTLEHPGDAYAYDIWSQIGAAVRGAAGVDVVGGEVTTLLAVGESQSAAFLTTYVNAVQPMADVFDGFLVHSRGAGAAALDGTPDVRGRAEGIRFRDDLDVPVLALETETDVGPTLGYANARQPDTDRIRVWEVAGTAHADAFLLGAAGAAIASLCPAPVNAGPQHYVAKAALESLLRWVREGVEPPSAEPIATGGEGGLTVQRDDLGNALGGVRTPSVDVPTAVLSGDPQPDSPALCFLFGSTTPLGPDAVAARYGTRADYLDAFDAALDDTVAAGFVRPADRDDYAAEARAVDFPAG